MIGGGSWSSAFFPAQTRRQRCAHTLVGLIVTPVSQDSDAHTVIDPVRGIVTPTHTSAQTHRQQRPLLSLFPLPAEYRLGLFCKFMLTFESTPPVPVHRSTKGCMNYHILLYNMIFLKWGLIRIHHTSLSFIGFSVAVGTVLWKKSSITVELREKTTDFLDQQPHCFAIHNWEGVWTSLYWRISERCRHSLSGAMSSWSVCQIQSTARA